MRAVRKGVAIRLAALHAATFLGMGIHLPFFPVWLASRALSPATIALVVAITIVVRILSTAPLLALADRRIGARTLLLASHAGQILGYLALPWLTGDMAIAAMAGLLAVCHAAVIPANDLVTMLAIRQHRRLHYGRIRAFGSVAFLGMSIAIGFLIDAIGPEIIPWGLALTPALGILATLWALPPGTAAEVNAAAPPTAAAGSLPKILWIVIAAAALIQASHAGLYTFGSIHWRSIGFSDHVIGMLWAAGIVAEIAVFALLGQAVGRGTGLNLLALGGAAAVLRFLTLSQEPGVTGTFMIQALHGLSFGATHLGSMAALAVLAPDGGRGRAQGVLGSAIALAMTGATLASGPLYQALGANLFAAMAPFSLAGLALALVAAKRLSNQPHRDGGGGNTTLPS
jgi:PPP family 3-phenylpropionic acid transporter